MRLGRKRSSRALRARFPFARFITRCHLPCLRRYADSDTNSDVQCDSLLYGQRAWGQPFGEPDSDEETNLLEDGADVEADTDPPVTTSHPPEAGAAHYSPPPSPTARLLSPTHLMSPGAASAATHQELLQAPPQKDITMSAPVLSIETTHNSNMGVNGATSEGHSPRSSASGDSRGSMGDVRFGLHNRFRLPLSQQYHCWQNMFGQHRTSGLPNRESPAASSTAASSTEGQGQQPLRERSPPRSRSSCSESQGESAEGAQADNEEEVESFQWPQNSRLSPVSGAHHFTSRIPSRSSWIMDLPLHPSTTETNESTLVGNRGKPFVLRPTRWQQQSDTLQSRTSTSSGSSINQSLFDPLSIPRSNPFADLAWPSMGSEVAANNNWSLSVPGSGERVQGRTGVVDNNSVALMLQDNSNLNTESSTDPPALESANETLHSYSTDVTSISLTTSDHGHNSQNEGHTSHTQHEHGQSQGHSEDCSQGNTESVQGQDLVNPLAYLFQQPTVNTDTLSSENSGTSSGRIDNDSLVQLESLLTNRDTLAMLFDARSRSNSSTGSSSNTSSLARPGADPSLQDWYFYDPRMAPGHHRGHLMQGLLGLPEIISPPSYDDIIQNQGMTLPPYIPDYGSQVLGNLDPLVLPQEPPPPYPDSILDPPPPYERGSNWSSTTQDDTNSLSSNSSSAYTMSLHESEPQTLSNQNQPCDQDASANHITAAESFANTSQSQSRNGAPTSVSASRMSMGLFGGRPPVRWNGGMRVDRWASTRSPNWLLH